MLKTGRERHYIMHYPRITVGRTPLKNVFISGCGDIGVRVAAIWQCKGARVRALARNQDSETRLNTCHIEAVKGDLDNRDSLNGLPLADAVLYHFAPPPTMGDTDPRLAALLGAIVSPRFFPAKVILISTSAVYGDCQGQWIDESAKVAPTTDRGKRRLDAEKTLRNWSRQTGVPYTILRVPGIYGPNRLPIERIESGVPILEETQSPFTNRIHADDLAAICVSAAQAAADNSLYNVSDGHPGTMAEYFKAIATAFHLPPPPEIDMAEAQRVLSPGMLSYLKESRRLKNDKLLHDLGITLLYPNLKLGLTQIISETKNQTI